MTAWRFAPLLRMTVWCFAPLRMTIAGTLTIVGRLTIVLSITIAGHGVALHVGAGCHF